MAFRRPEPYNHKEAFCLMLYRDEAGNEEWIWNSRDGVTPYCIDSRQGLEAKHVDWSRDKCMPDYKPKAGERIFVDLTVEKAKEYRRRYVEHYWDRETHGSKMSDHYPSKEEAIEMLARADMERSGTPDLIEVTYASI